jgi:hypothetical protein
MKENGMARASGTNRHDDKCICNCSPAAGHLQQDERIILKRSERKSI